MDRMPLILYEHPASTPGIHDMALHDNDYYSIKQPKKDMKLEVTLFFINDSHTLYV